MTPTASPYTHTLSTLACLTALLSACSSSSPSNSIPEESLDDAGDQDSSVSDADGDSEADSAGDSEPNSETSVDKNAPAVQCPTPPCPIVAWARVSDTGASNAWGSHAVIEGNARFALFDSGSAATLRGPSASEELSLSYGSGALLTLDSAGASSRRIDLENVSLMGGLAAAKDGRVAFVTSRGPLVKATTVAGEEIPVTDTANAVVVLDVSGAVSWSVALDGTYNDTELAFTSDGGLVFGGSRKGGISNRPVIRKWTSSGVEAWQSPIDTTATTWATVTGVAVAQNGNLFVVGFHSGELTSVDLPSTPSSFLLELSSATGDTVWAKNLGDHASSPSLVVVENDVIVATNTIARYQTGSSAPVSATWTVTLPSGVSVLALASDGARIAVLGGLREPTSFPFGTLGTTKSTVTNGASGLFVLDITTQGEVEGGFSINTDPADPGTVTMAAHSVSMTSDGLLVSGTFTPSIDLGFGPVHGSFLGQFVVEFARP